MAVRPIIVGSGRTLQLNESGRLSEPERHDRIGFCSILFESPDDHAVGEEPQAPTFFPDLNCDQIVAALVAGKEEYNLKPYFYSALRRIQALHYRHDVMRDLESDDLFGRVTAFAQSMHDIREHLVRVKKLHYKEQRQAWFLDAVDIYCKIMTSFAGELSATDLGSRGFLGFRDYLTRYVASPSFRSLVAETARLKVDLGSVDYCVQIKDGGFTVRKYEGEKDYSAEVEATFEKFKQGAVKDYRVKFSISEDMNHIEAKILEFVGKLHPGVFGELNQFCAQHLDFIDPTVALFDREVQFYIAYLQYIRPLRDAGLLFCYPRVSRQSKEVYSVDSFDVALAHKLVGVGAPVVCNDFYLKGSERILVISGPNQGGKTTFARAFGQLHYLANIGCPVPGRDAQLFLFDRIFTHFEKEEKVENLRGKLEEDLTRVHEILAKATPQSIIIFNEVFTSTTIHDETFLSEKVMEKIIAIGALCAWVTFVDELASFGPQTVSMVSTVAPDNPALRTFKVLRRPADGLAYAMAIAQKYGLTYESIKGRIQP